ncbi:hypothetical protein ACS0TY_004145 [Phlomoides rotata]
MGTSIFPINITQWGLITEKLARPFSTGYLELQSDDLNENPKVTFNYFKDPRDFQRCVQSMEIARRAIELKTFSGFRDPAFTSFESQLELTLQIPSGNLRRRHLIKGDLSLERFRMDTVITLWHYHGGCQVDRVIDPEYKLMGVESLCVIDGSTFYNTSRINPQAMLGRYMGKKIMQQTN